MEKLHTIDVEVDHTIFFIAVVKTNELNNVLNTFVNAFFYSYLLVFLSSSKH